MKGEVSVVKLHEIAIVHHPEHLRAVHLLVLLYKQFMRTGEHRV